MAEKRWNNELHVTHLTLGVIIICFISFLLTADTNSLESKISVSAIYIKLQVHQGAEKKTNGFYSNHLLYIFNQVADEDFVATITTVVVSKTNIFFPKEW